MGDLKLHWSAAWCLASLPFVFCLHRLTICMRHLIEIRKNPFDKLLQMSDFLKTIPTTI